MLNTFFKKILENVSPFCGATDTQFWTSGDVSSGFQSQSGQPYSCFDGGIHVTCSIRFTSGVTPADLLVACMVAKPFSST